MAGSMTREAARELARQAWRLVNQQGLTQRQAAERLGVDQSTVSRHLQQLEAELNEEFREEVDTARARQVLHLEALLQQAWQQWEQSCQPQVKVRATTGRILRARGELHSLPDLVTTTTSSSLGNPRYLLHALRALSDLRSLYRLPAASISTPSAPSVSSTGHAASPGPACITMPADSPAALSRFDASSCGTDANSPLPDLALPAEHGPTLMRTACSSDAGSAGELRRPTPLPAGLGETGYPPPRYLPEVGCGSDLPDEGPTDPTYHRRPDLRDAHLVLA